jgi:hypothetical protein
MATLETSKDVYEEAHRLFTIKEFEELIETHGVSYVWDRLAYETKEVLKDAVQANALNKH